jgi:hypothetical protein
VVLLEVEEAAAVVESDGKITIYLINKIYRLAFKKKIKQFINKKNI